MLSKELVAASSRPLVLSLLAEGDSYGYALLQRIRDVSAREIEWTDGMLYPVLHRLEAEGLILSSWKLADNGRERKYYRLTPQGRNALLGERRQWLAVHTTLSSLWNLQPSST